MKKIILITLALLSSNSVFAAEKAALEDPYENKNFVNDYASKFLEFKKQQVQETLKELSSSEKNPEKYKELIEDIFDQNLNFSKNNLSSFLFSFPSEHFPAQHEKLMTLNKALKPFATAQGMQLLASSAQHKHTIKQAFRAIEANYNEIIKQIKDKIDGRPIPEFTSYRNMLRTPQGLINFAFQQLYAGELDKALSAVATLQYVYPTIYSKNLLIKTAINFFNNSSSPDKIELFLKENFYPQNTNESCKTDTYCGDPIKWSIEKANANLFHKEISPEDMLYFVYKTAADNDIPGAIHYLTRLAIVYPGAKGGSPANRIKKQIVTLEMASMLSECTVYNNENKEESSQCALNILWKSPIKKSPHFKKVGNRIVEK